jgi:two-component system sensor histidine kinase KdpD
MDTGIKVVASINVQYIAELREDVEAITGKSPSQTVPVSFIKSADEIEIVDAPPEEPGEHSPEQRAEAAIRQQRRSKLRELALVLAADVVDHQLIDYLEQHGIRQQFSAHEQFWSITPRSNVRR